MNNKFDKAELLKYVQMGCVNPVVKINPLSQYIRDHDDIFAKYKYADDLDKCFVRYAAKSDDVDLYKLYLLTCIFLAVLDDRFDLKTAKAQEWLHIFEARKLDKNYNNEDMLNVLFNDMYEIINKKWNEKENIKYTQTFIEWLECNISGKFKHSKVKQLLAYS